MNLRSILVVLILSVVSFDAESAGVVARRQQMMEQQKAAYQQAMQQQQAQQIAQQQAMYNQAMQQRAVQQQAMQQAAYQQAAQQQAMQEGTYQQAMAQQQLQRRALQTAPSTGWNVPEAQYGSTSKAAQQPTQTASLEVIWQQLASSSRVWAQMADKEPKEMTVKRYMELFAKQGVYIRKSPVNYVDMIDDMAQANPEMLNAPFRDIIRIMAILEYDYDNGQDREELIRQVLGQDGYARNLERVRQGNSRLVD